ncbi:hypothetical protein MTO96_022751 [Rhipicephalus appendiculatus]
MWLRWRFISIFATPVFLLPLGFVIGGKAGWCAFVVIWMAIYWVTEVIPLAITSLMPLVLFPLLGILSSQRVASFYLNEIGIILVCAMIVGVAVETSNLHKRIALKSILTVGTSNRRLLLGLMLVTMFLSMWTPQHFHCIHHDSHRHGRCRPDKGQFDDKVYWRTCPRDRFR